MNLTNKILCVCALVLLFGACAFIAKGNFGRALIVAAPAIGALWFVSNDKKKIK